MAEGKENDRRRGSGLSEVKQETKVLTPSYRALHAPFLPSPCFSTPREIRNQPKLMTQTIPAAVTQLPALQRLRLDGNLLQGSFPSGVNALTNLSVLCLSRNLLSGNLPAAISSLDSLNVL